MESKKNNLVDKTILNTPKPTATSTAEKKYLKKKTIFNNIDKDDSLGILSLSQMSLSNILEEQSQNRPSTAQTNVSHNLEEQRSLAETSLQRANNKVDALPSKYFKPSPVTPSQNYQMNVSTESTINESDLLRAPADSSTPQWSLW